MTSAKKLIYLTDITLHTREFRQTVNFSKAAEKGRIYTPVSKDHFKSTDSKTGNFEVTIALPDDLQKQVDNNEVELMMPKDGLLIYAGRDMAEKVEQAKEQERIQLIHRNRKNIFRSE